MGHLLTQQFDGSFQNLGNSKAEYEKLIVTFSIKNQLRYKGNLGGKPIIKI